MVLNAITPILLHSKLLKGSQDEFIPLHCTYTNYLLTVKVIHQSERRSEVISIHTVHDKQTLWLGKNSLGNHTNTTIFFRVHGHNTLHFNGRKYVQTSRLETGVIKKIFSIKQNICCGCLKELSHWDGFF